jgi:integrase
VPLTEDINEYFAREVLPHVPDAWIDHDKTKIGYEIPSPATSTATSRPGHWRRSRRTSAFLLAKSRPCSPRSARELAPTSSGSGRWGRQTHQQGPACSVLQRMLGHAKASMTLDVYADLFDADLDDVAVNLDAAIRAAADAAREDATQ